MDHYITVQHKLVNIVPHDTVNYQAENRCAGILDVVGVTGITWALCTNVTRLWARILFEGIDPRALL